MLTSIHTLIHKSTCLSKYVVRVKVKVREPNLGLTQLMYITKLVDPGDVQLKVLNVAKECCCAIATTHSYEQG